MSKRLLICLLIFLVTAIHAQENFIKLNQTIFTQGDTINFNCKLSATVRFATLHVWIEDLVTLHKWKFRYPIIDGGAEGYLVIDSTLANGRYAFNFLVNPRFFSLRGNVIEGGSKELSGMNYSMLTKNNASFFDKTETDKSGRFSLKGVLFEDSAYFTFTPGKPGIKNDLKLSIVTPLDSSFKSDSSFMQIIAVGKQKELPVVTKANEPAYHLNHEQFYTATTLPEVTVGTTTKKQIELFNDRYSTGLFRNPAELIFDGLEQHTIAQTISVFDFIQGRVPGLRVRHKPNSDSYILTWNGPSSFRLESNVDVFIDEQKVEDLLDDKLIATTNIAMIKAIPPPAFLTGGGSRGAIIIYTKRGGPEEVTVTHNQFRVYGYTALEAIWKN